MRHCGKVAAAAGVSHRVWNDTEARALLADGFPNVVAEAYDIAPHASMKSDVFRLAVLQRHGGVYVDADMVLRKERGADLWASFTEALVFKSIPAALVGGRALWVPLRGAMKPRWRRAGPEVLR
nr:glycosyltransferase [Gymnodinialimonas phycosphaerae]